MRDQFVVIAIQGSLWKSGGCLRVPSSGLMEVVGLERNETVSQMVLGDAQGLRTLAVLIEDVPSLHMVTHNHP